MARPGMVGNLEAAVAAKMAPTTPGPSTTPPGWSKGQKKGWGGGKVPPGLARVRAGQQSKPTMPMRPMPSKMGGM